MSEGGWFLVQGPWDENIAPSMDPQFYPTLDLSLAFRNLYDCHPSPLPSLSAHYQYLSFSLDLGWLWLIPPLDSLLHIFVCLPLKCSSLQADPPGRHFPCPHLPVRNCLTPQFISCCVVCSSFAFLALPTLSQ